MSTVTTTKDLRCQESFMATVGSLIHDTEIYSRIFSLVKRTLDFLLKANRNGLMSLSQREIVLIKGVIKKCSHSSDVFLFIRFFQEAYTFLHKMGFFTISEKTKTVSTNKGQSIDFGIIIRFSRMFSILIKIAFIFQKMKFFQMSLRMQSFCFISYPIIKIFISTMGIANALVKYEETNERPEEMTEEIKNKRFVVILFLIKQISSFVAGIFALIILMTGLPHYILIAAVVGVVIDLATYANHLVSLAYKFSRKHYHVTT